MNNEMISFLEKYKFDKQLKKLNKKLKNKKVLIYGAGLLFQAIKENYDLSKLNIIAISDQKFAENEEEYFAGYKTCKPADIASLNPDYVLVSTVRTISIIEYLRYVLLEDKEIKILPFVRKSIIDTIKEIWS